jgi:hypothetical protein
MIHIIRKVIFVGESERTREVKTEKEAERRCRPGRSDDCGFTLARRRIW